MRIYSTDENGSMNERAPVLFLIYNRPDLTRMVFEAIRAYRPPLLFVAADGPRAESPDDERHCVQARAVVANVDWPCRVATRFRDKNMGCRDAVADAIHWFFECVEAGIILEDDCLPDPTFFRFCEEMLARYAEVETICSISGNSFWNPQLAHHDSYTFSIYPHIWGWATWKRSWASFRETFPSDSPIFDDRWLGDWLKDENARRFWRTLIDKYARQGIDTWDYPWLFTCWLNHSFGVVPYANLVSNIGFDARGTFCKNPRSQLAMQTLQPARFPLQHPLSIERSADMEKASMNAIMGAGPRHSSLNPHEPAGSYRIKMRQIAKGFSRRLFGARCIQ